METILSSDLREQAGSNSFNRFDYQAHWIVYHMINEYKKNSEFFIFCEFHDDMAKTDISSSVPSCAEFFQIKTTEKYKEWTLTRLTNTTKKSNGKMKHSFLGFIFYNFINFKNECKICHFVSNIGVDKKVSTWQSIIEDGKDLKKENEEIYHEIKTLLKEEYLDLENEKFEQIFDIFVQNTFIYHGDLTLENYEKVVAGEFFQMLDNAEIFTSNSNKILRDIIEDVRRKSKKKIGMPISYNSLKEAKGISSNIFSKLKEQVNNISYTSEIYTEIEGFLKENSFSTPQRRILIRKLKNHHQKMLDIGDSLYQDTLNELTKIIDKTLEESYEKIDDLNFIKNEVMKFTQKSLVLNNGFDKILVEAIIYERILS